MPDAAGRLDVSAQRVRQLIYAGELDAQQLAGRWLVDISSLERVVHGDRRAGRPWAPARSWALLALAGGREPDWLPGGERSRLEQALAQSGIHELAGRLRHRAERRYWYIHPALLARLLDEDGVVVSGAKASGRLRDSGPIEAYVHPALVDGLADEYAPDAESDEPNLIVRVVRGPWPFQPGERQAWPEVVAVDLLERSEDARARQVAEELLSHA